MHIVEEDNETLICISIWNTTFIGDKIGCRKGCSICVMPKILSLYQTGLFLGIHGIWKNVSLLLRSMLSFFTFLKYILYGTSRSLYKVWLLTPKGVSRIVNSVFDWKYWKAIMLVVLYATISFHSLHMSILAKCGFKDNYFVLWCVFPLMDTIYFSSSGITHVFLLGCVNFKSRLPLSRGQGISPQF